MTSTTQIKKSTDINQNDDYYLCSRPLGWQEPSIIIPFLGQKGNQRFIKATLKRFPYIRLIQNGSYTSNTEMLDNIDAGLTTILVAKDGCDLPAQRLRVAINTCLGGRNREQIPANIYRDSGCSVYLRVPRRWKEEGWMFGIEPFTTDKLLFRELSILESLNKNEKRG